MGFFTRVFEKIALFSRVIYINKRSTLVAFIGLGISLALVTESLTFLYSYQFDAFNKYVKENPYEQITITPSNMIITYNREETIISDLEGLIDQSSIYSNVKNKINYRYFLNRRAVLLEYKDFINNNTNLFTTTFVGISNDFLNIVQPYILVGGRLPTNPSEVLLFLRPGRIATTNLTIGESNIYVIINGNRIDTKRRKLGAIIGDNVQTGINSMINTGSTIGNNCFLGLGSIINGEIKPYTKIL